MEVYGRVDSAKAVDTPALLFDRQGGVCLWGETAGGAYVVTSGAYAKAAEEGKFTVQSVAEAGVSRTAAPNRVYELQRCAR